MRLPFTTPFNHTDKRTITGHNSAFDALWSFTLDQPSILLNGQGNVTRYNNANGNTAEIPPLYQLHFDPPDPTNGLKPKRYLLRIINTSFESTFIFSIDMHHLIVVEADFVPIKPYTTETLLVGIGQRYHLIVEAIDPIGGHNNYWLRTWRAKCFVGFPANGSADYEKTGFINYSQPGDDTVDDIIDLPWPVNFNCSDEKAEDLVPWVSWPEIPPPANDPKGKVGENLTVLFQPAPNIFPKALASMGSGNDIQNPEFNPLQVNYGDPIFMHLNFTGKWPPAWVVYPENYTADSFVSVPFVWACEKPLLYYR